ncbi:MAG: Verru_Chthon cassette protein B [Candidatus Methylacidiphilales bacterium]|nr:Verru_Chthon cassette protein B [Candidatus Methylacidiphilales bacterium]
MNPFKPAFHGRNRAHRRSGAFTLVETTLALGILSFSLLTTVALIPIGMNTFRESMDRSVSSYIVQQVTADVRQSTLAATNSPIRRFDDQGNELQADGAPANEAGYVYYVNVVPQAQSTVPGGQSSKLTTVTVEVVKNPSLQTLQIDGEGLVVKAPGLNITRFPFFVAR